MGARVRSDTHYATLRTLQNLEAFASLTWYRHPRHSEKKGASMAFEVFDKRNAPLAKSPSITIQRRGIFSINKAAHKLMGEAETVELLYDRENRVIGLRPSAASPHAYAIRQQASRDTGQAILSATAFTQYYDIDTSVSRRWEPYLEDGILCINLAGPSTEVHGNRAKKRTASAQEADA